MGIIVRRTAVAWRTASAAAKSSFTLLIFFISDLIQAAYCVRLIQNLFVLDLDAISFERLLTTGSGLSECLCQVLLT